MCKFGRGDYFGEIPWAQRLKCPVSPITIATLEVSEFMVIKYKDWDMALSGFPQIENLARQIALGRLKQNGPFRTRILNLAIASNLRHKNELETWKQIRRKSDALRVKNIQLHQFKVKAKKEASKGGDSGRASMNADRKSLRISEYSLRGD